MLPVIIPKDLIIAPVRLDTLEMEEIALVITCYNFLCVSTYVIEVYPSRLNKMLLETSFRWSPYRLLALIYATVEG